MASYRVELINHRQRVLVQGDNMYLNAFNNNLIPREGFLLLNNLPTVVQCCRRVLRLFMSTVRIRIRV